jgi:hypothetical protein
MLAIAGYVRIQGIRQQGRSTLHQTQEPFITERRAKGNAMHFRTKFCLSLMSVGLASILATGCRPHHDHRDHDDQPAPVAAQPAQPAPVNETVVYNQWEGETHRAHVDLEKRSAAEQREYQAWREKHR